VLCLICKPDFNLAPGANAFGDVWRIFQETGNPHPAPFRVELAQRCIESTMSDIVLDPFMGSGSTAIAAEGCGRSWIGSEISQEYCKLANRRIQTARKLEDSRLSPQPVSDVPTPVIVNPDRRPSSYLRYIPASDQGWESRNILLPCFKSSQKSYHSAFPCFRPWHLKQRT
jgi:hypothetical protein